MTDVSNILYSSAIQLAVNNERDADDGIDGKPRHAERDVAPLACKDPERREDGSRRAGVPDLDRWRRADEQPCPEVDGREEQEGTRAERAV